MAQSLAGASAAEQAAARDKAKKAPPSKGPRKVEDQVEINVDTPDAAEAARRLSGNSDEETAQDRREHPTYDQSKDARRTQRIDVEG